MSGAGGHYEAWGLGLRSEVEVPFLPPDDPRADPDVVIRFGPVPLPSVAAPLAPPWESAAGAFRLEVEGVARYLVREGREITVDPVGDRGAGASAFLLGPVMAACLQQRGILPLRASAVETGRGAVLVAGASGGGKSTLAATLVERGHRLISDDLVGIVSGPGGGPLALPAFPGLRLWADTVERLGWEGRKAGRVREGIERYRVPVRSFRAAPLGVRAVFVLGSHNRDGFEVETVPPRHAFELLPRLAWGPDPVPGPGARRDRFRALAALAREVPLRRATRPRRAFPPYALAEEIERCLEGKAPAGPGPPRRAAWTRPPRGVPAAESVAGSRAGSIVWLASYPKSGNTWLRALLTSYLRDGEPASINALVGSTIASRRERFDRVLGVPSSDLTHEEILRLRPRFHALLARDLPHPAFVKVHEACLHTAGGPLFPRAATAGAVCLVRHPCDVAVSFAHHQQWSIERTVAEMNRPGASLAGGRRRAHSVLPQPLGTWSGHVTSWLDSDLPLHVVRYEDMLADPRAAFGGVVRFAGLGWDPARLARAVDHAAFARLRAEEERVGFDERQPTAPSFFRSGTAGGWRNVLAPEQVRALVDAHAPTMARFGYLRDAEAFLAAAARSRGSSSACLHDEKG